MKTTNKQQPTFAFLQRNLTEHANSTIKKQTHTIHMRFVLYFLINLFKCKLDT